MAFDKNAKEKYQERILNEVNNILRFKLSDMRLQFVSATKVELDRDYSHAKVYWDTFDSSKKNEISEAMIASRGKFRSLLANTLNVRHIPQINFIYDAQYESELEITKLLDSEKTDGRNF